VITAISDMANTPLARISKKIMTISLPISDIALTPRPQG
jgi:hypothetical protein